MKLSTKDHFASLSFFFPISVAVIILKKKFGSNSSANHDDLYSGERHDIEQTLVNPTPRTTTTTKSSNNNNLQNIRERIKDAFENKNSSGREGLDDLFVVPRTTTKSTNNDNLQNIKERIKDAFENKNSPGYDGLDDLVDVSRSPESQIQPVEEELEDKQQQHLQDEEVQVYVVDDLGRQQHPQNTNPHSQGKRSSRDYHYFQEKQNDKEYEMQSNTCEYKEERHYMEAKSPESVLNTEQSIDQDLENSIIIPRNEEETKNDRNCNDNRIIQSSSSSLRHPQLFGPRSKNINISKAELLNNNMLYQQQQDSLNENTTTDKQISASRTSLPDLFDATLHDLSVEQQGTKEIYPLFDKNKLPPLENLFERSKNSHDFTDSGQASMAIPQNQSRSADTRNREQGVFPSFEVSLYRNDGQHNEDGAYHGPNKASEDISRLVVIDKEVRIALTTEIKGCYDRIEIEGIKRYVCKLCQKTFERWCNLNAHVTMHLDLKPYVCKLCGAKYKLRSILNDHIRVSHLHRTTKYKCKTCKMNFRKQSGLFKHATETRHTV